MGNDGARAFMERLLDDPHLRAEFQRDPRAAAARAGAELDGLDLSALSAMDWSGTNHELRSRAKGACGSGCGD